MATAAQRASKVTTLKVGKVEVPVGLFSVEAKPGQLQKFDTAGPNGGVLKARQVARPTPETSVMEATFTAQGDPLGDEVVDVREQDGAVFVPAEPEHKFVVDGEDFTLSQQGDSVTIFPEGSAERIKEIMREEDPSIRTDARSIPGALADAAGAQIDALADALNHVQPGDAIEVTETISYSDGEYGRELVEEGSGVVVKPEDVRRGVRLEDGSFVDCTEQLAKIDEDTQLEGMEVVSFVDATQIHRLRVKASHYIGAVDGSSPKPLRLFYEAMRQTRRAAVVKVTKRSRQSLGALSVYGGVLVLYELIFASDVRDVPPRARVIQKAQVTEREVEMAVALVEAMSGTIDTLDALSDDAISRRAELKAQALAGGVVAPVSELGPTDEQSVLLAQLEASLAAA